MLYVAILCSALQYYAIRANTMLYVAILCYTLRYYATVCACVL